MTVPSSDSLEVPPIVFERYNQPQKYEFAPNPAFKIESYTYLPSFLPFFPILHFPPHSFPALLESHHLIILFLFVIIVDFILFFKAFPFDEE